jgi:hypothetical protein
MKAISSIPIRSRIAVPFGLVALIFALSIRLLIFIDQKAVNILFWDQWDFLTPLFANQSGWALFLWQHGIHRMGMGYFLIQMLASLTHWNTRADSFAIFVLIFMAMLAALFLKRKLFGSITWSDAAIPLIFLTATQYEIFIGTPDEAVAAMPLLLLMLEGLAWLIHRPAWRYPAVILVGFFLLFGGYGFLATPMIFILMILDLSQGVRARSKTQVRFATGGIVLMALSVILFLNGYQNVHNGSCDTYTVGTILRSPIFMAVMFAKFIGVDFVSARFAAILIGAAVLILVIGALIVSGVKLFHGKLLDERIHLVSFLLIGFSVLFSGSSALGRVCLGIGSAQASRYMTLIIPAFLGLYFAVLNFQPRKLANLSCSVILIGLLFGQLPYGSTDQGIIRFFSDQKEDWKRCYLAQLQIDPCNQSTGYRVYPTTNQKLQTELEYLQEHHFNLFIDAPDPTGP